MHDTPAHEKLLTAIGYRFHDSALLEEALTHRSAGAKNNERLEFLGDSILNFVIADELFKRYPDSQEGDLSRLRANLVNKDSLAAIAQTLALGQVIRLGAGEMKSGGHRRPSILADAVESLIGAVYCDSDFATAQKLVKHLYTERLRDKADLQQLKDPKTRLQELLQSRKYPLPVYRVLRISGKAHAQVFHVECVIERLGLCIKGEGRSRRKAEQLAAQAAIAAVNEAFGK